MKKTTSIILVLLIVSLGYNVYSITTSAPDVSPCDDSKRYGNETSGGGISTTSGNVKSKITEYRSQHAEDTSAYKTTGFVLSKRVCDEIFKNGDLNALNFDVIIENGQLNMVVKGIQTTKTGIDVKAGNDIFLVQTFCPTECTAW